MQKTTTFDYMKDSFITCESDDYLKIELHESSKWYLELASKFFGIIVGLIFIGFVILSCYELYQMILFYPFEIGTFFLFLLSISIVAFIWYAIKTQIEDDLYKELVVMTPQTFEYSRTIMFVSYRKIKISLREIDAFNVLGETELSEEIDENEVLADLTEQEVEESEMSDEDIIRFLSEDQRMEEERAEKITIKDIFEKKFHDPKKDFKIEVTNWKEPLYMGRSITSWDAKTIVMKMDKFRLKYSIN